MKISKNVGSNIERMCISHYFILAVFLTIFLMMSGYIYTDASNGKAYSLISLIIMKNPQAVIRQARLNWNYTYLMESPGYTWMFAPIVVTLPYITVICPGNTNSNTRFEMFRTSRKKYVLGKIISGMLVSGMIMAIAQTAYGVISYFVMGNEYTGDINLMDLYKLHGITGYVYKYSGSVSVYIFRGLEAFLYGMVSSVPVILLSAIIKNKYLVCSISFMLNYFIIMFLNNGLTSLCSEESAYEINRILVQSNIQSVFLNENTTVIMTMLWMVLQFLLTYVLHYFMLERRCDYCER